MEFQGLVRPAIALILITGETLYIIAGESSRFSQVPFVKTVHMTFATECSPCVLIVRGGGFFYK